MQAERPRPQSHRESTVPLNPPPGTLAGRRQLREEDIPNNVLRDEEQIDPTRAFDRKLRICSGRLRDLDSRGSVHGKRHRKTSAVLRRDLFAACTRVAGRGCGTSDSQIHHSRIRLMRCFV
jgi:hypothetical protein